MALGQYIEFFLQIRLFIYLLDKLYTDNFKSNIHIIKMCKKLYLKLYYLKLYAVRGNVRYCNLKTFIP